MTLSVELVAESMKKFGGEILLAQERSFDFTKIQMLSLDELDDLAEDVLYVSEPKILFKIPKSKFKDHCFVFKARLQQLERYKQFVNAIVFDEQYHLNDVINHLLNLFDSINSLEQQMQQAVLKEEGFTPIIEVARKMFPGSTFLVVDSAYNIIAATDESVDCNDYVDSLLKQRFYDKQSIDRMANMGYFDDAEKYLVPVLVNKPNICGCPVMLRSYHENGAFFSFCSCYFFDHEPTPSEQRLFQCITEQVDVYYRISGFYEHSLPKRQKLIDDLIHSSDVSPELLRDRCQGLMLPQQGEFRLGYIVIESGQTLKASHLSIQLRAWCGIPNYGVYQYGSTVIILFRDWHSYAVADRTGFAENWKNLLDILKTNNAAMGMSLLFSNMNKFRSAFRQAESALKVGRSLDPKAVEYPYSKYYINDMLEHYSQKLELDDIYVQYLDKLAGDSGVGYSNLVLLYNYVSSERNISLTAKKVHMHRNSIIYRLQKIQDTLEMDMDDPDVRLRLMISFKILQMENKLKVEKEPEESGSDEESHGGDRIIMME